MKVSSCLQLFISPATKTCLSGTKSCHRTALSAHRFQTWWWRRSRHLPPGSLWLALCLATAQEPAIEGLWGAEGNEALTTRQRLLEKISLSSLQFFVGYRKCVLKSSVKTVNVWMQHFFLSFLCFFLFSVFTHFIHTCVLEILHRPSLLHLYVLWTKLRSKSAH